MALQEVLYQWRWALRFQKLMPFPSLSRYLSLIFLCLSPIVCLSILSLSFLSLSLSVYVYIYICVCMYVQSVLCLHLV